MSIKVTCTKDGLCLSQTKYIRDLLDKIKLIESKPIKTPIVVSQHLSKAYGEELIDATQFQIIVDTLQYCTLVRLEINLLIKKLC